MLGRYHNHELSPTQCGSCLTQTIDAPLGLVWSVIRRFDEPQIYKRFIKSCKLSKGDGGVGSVREVRIVSGLPAGSSIERLDLLDDESHVMSFSIVGGDHRLVNYRSTITVHENNYDDVDDDDDDDLGHGRSTVVIESYVVDVPPGNTDEDTKLFADTIVRFNLKSLASVTEKIRASSSTSEDSSF
ncbi:Polyketide cyclase/dehydrase [Macleaya cordata]|uniref:Polyketide cyclase/dehydrase n=1 Tax=Macleaya cordata TaxID=56857 RepID=A0A200R1E8_MACCD|nr:Polyketide cyclase/dehydrase [Macleaya cordata]